MAADEVLVTSGSQQGLDLTGQLLLDEDDVVLCESPTYIGAINAFRAYRPRFVEVATDDDGMLPGELEARIADEPRAQLIYVVPNFQNPTGRTWSLDRREALLALAVRHRLPVIEDNPYGEVCFDGETAAVAGVPRPGRSGGAPRAPSPRSSARACGSDG